jgi:protein SCO1/2
VSVRSHPAIPFLAFWLIGLLVSCRHGPPPARPGAGAPPSEARTFTVQGTVREVRPDRRSARIRHEAIPGYMAAMTMPFEVRDPQVLAGVGPGDTVQFRLQVTETEGWIDELRVIERGELEDPKPRVDSVRAVRDVDELHTGDLMPDYRFVSEQRQALTLSQFRGQALGFTFIYTRCPYPTFCPRQCRQFAEAARALSAHPGGATNWHLLSISFDPGYDTPSVLRRYARQFAPDPTRWNFVTGAIADIDAITEQFGLVFARDGEGFSHNVRTVVVDAAGRIQHIFVGNEWTVDEFVAEMVRAARAPRAP